MAGESDKTNDKGYFPCPYVAVTFCIKFMSKSGKPERRAKFGACQKLFNNVNKCQIFLTLVSFLLLFIMSARNVVNYSHLDCSRSASTYQDADLGLTGVFSCLVMST